LTVSGVCTSVERSHDHSWRTPEALVVYAKRSGA
jgi:hypothetical protein